MKNISFLAEFKEFNNAQRKRFATGPMNLQLERLPFGQKNNIWVVKKFGIQLC